MHTTRLRKVGGSVMLAVPPALLDVLEVGVGTEVGLALHDGQLVVSPRPRPRYTLDQLILEAEAAGHLYGATVEDREWIDAPAAGRELV